jgi:hypothetical protein
VTIVPNEEQPLQGLRNGLRAANCTILHADALHVHINSVVDLALVLAEALRSPVVANQLAVLQSFLR